MDRIEAMRVLLRVVETGSFSQAARERNATQSAVSKIVSALEAQLGARLLQRTTRSLSLTDEGRSFLPGAAAAVQAFDEAQASVGSAHGRVSGLLRMSCPVAFGRLHVVPRLRRLLDRFPDLRVDLTMSDGFVNLVEQGIDVAIRIGQLPDATLVSRRIGLTRRVTVASPDYFAAHGEPAVPGDLEMHDCIVYTRLATGNEWRFSGPKGPITVKVSGRVMADNSEAVREAVLSGCGIAVTPTWLFGDEIETGRARVVLRDFEPVRLPIQAVYPSRRFVPARVGAAVAFFAEEFRLDPALSDYGARRDTIA